MSNLTDMNIAYPCDLIAQLRDEVKALGGVRTWARTHHVNASLVTMTLSGERRVSDTIAFALGFKPPNYYIRRETNDVAR
jgi:hypothetical protein